MEFLDDVEYINALGPFDHGVWEGSNSDGKKVSVGTSALFRNRSIWLVDKITNYLTQNFSKDALQSMKILEVGSYDGWVLTQICKQIEFSEAIGVEPRKKNIMKGQVGRRLENITTKAEFIQGSLYDLGDLFGNRKFDIVICLGMLHHVSSTYDAIAKLSQYTLDVVIIDSMIVPELQNDVSRLQPFVNTRDIVYQGEEGNWSIAAFKHESPYGDGSRADYGIVNIPSASLIQMSLHNLGFSKSTVLGNESEFFDNSEQILRGVKELLVVSRRELSQSEIDKKWMDKVKASEEIFCHVCLPDIVVMSLVNNFVKFDDLSINTDIRGVIGELDTQHIDDTICSIITRGVTEKDKEILRMNVNSINDNHFQILSVIFRMPFDKIILEVGKLLAFLEHPTLAIKYLKLIVSKPGCDWWSFYRSCYVLKQSFLHLGLGEEASHYNDLLLTSNENFPFNN